MARSRRVVPTTAAEERARLEGYHVVAGVDEAGRGPLAGPVVAACVVVPPQGTAIPVADSKTMTPEGRKAVWAAIQEAGWPVGVGLAAAREIDELNILRSTHLAMTRAIQNCPVRPDFALVDGLPVPGLPVPHRAIVKGDATCVSIAAASIAAKVERDRIMEELDQAYPGYGFAAHKGYPTPEHLEALARLGPCPEHRRSFKTVRDAARTRSLFPETELPSGGSGSLGEDLAVLYLERLGHVVLDRRFRTADGEIDIISRDGDTLVFTEVKTASRPSDESALLRLTVPQRRRLCRAALSYLSEQATTECSCRFDVVEVVLRRGGPVIRHYAAAFEAEPVMFDT